MNHRYVLRDRQRLLSEEVLYTVLRTPIITEKSTRQQPHYFFLVAPWANKFSIKQAVEKIFNVKVKSVNTLCLKGKVKRFKGRLGVRSDTKKAMIALHDGYSLDISSGVLS